MTLSCPEPSVLLKSSESWGHAWSFQNPPGLTLVQGDRLVGRGVFTGPCKLRHTPQELAQTNTLGQTLCCLLDLITAVLPRAHLPRQRSPSPPLLTPPLTSSPSSHLHFLLSPLTSYVLLSIPPRPLCLSSPPHLSLPLPPTSFFPPFLTFFFLLPILSSHLFLLTDFPFSHYLPPSPPCLPCPLILSPPFTYSVPSLLSNPLTFSFTCFLSSHLLLSFLSFHLSSLFDHLFCLFSLPLTSPFLLP